MIRFACICALVLCVGVAQAQAGLQGPLQRPLQGSTPAVQPAAHKTAVLLPGQLIIGQSVNGQLKIDRWDAIGDRPSLDRNGTAILVQGNGRFCAELDALARPDAVPALGLPADLSGAMPLSARTAVCRPSVGLSGASHVHCHWSFAYRSDAAELVFQGLINQMAACLGPEAIMRADTSVNHPDAYDLRMFDLAGRTFAVSLKDKGALQQTLVFVRVQQR